jgi:hypothetical protein
MTNAQRAALESAIDEFKGCWQADELRELLDDEARRTVSGQEVVGYVSLDLLKQADNVSSIFKKPGEAYVDPVYAAPIASRADADTAGAKPVAEVVIEADYWSGGHFYEGSRKEAKLLLGFHELPVGTKLFAATPASTVADAAGAMSDVRDFQRELANYFEDIGDPSGATMIRNFSDLSGYAGASAAKQQSTPAYSAPFTTDVPHCCGDPDACNDPCIEVSDAAMERSVSAAERLMEKLGETTFVRKKEPK